MGNGEESLSRPRRRRLGDLRLRNRLVLLVLLPLIASVALGTARVVTESNAIGAESDLSGQVQVALSVSKLVHAVQDERDLIALYLANGQQPSDMSTLAGAQSATSQQVQAFQAAQQQYAGAIRALSPSAQALALQAGARLGDLPALRSSVVSLGDSRPVFQAYTTIISSLLNLSGQLATGTTDHTLGNYVSTLSLVEQTGEQTSQERGFLVSIIGGGAQLREQQEDLIQAQAKYTSAFASFSAQAQPQTASLFQSTVGGEATGTTDSLVQQAIDAALEQRPVDTIGVNGRTAFAAATSKIEQIRTVEGQIGGQALDRTSVLLSAARTQLSLNAGIVAFTLLLAFLATALIARSIVEPLRVLRSSAYQIATVGLPEVIRRLRDASDPAAVEQHTKTSPIAVDSRDEIGEVARAFDAVHEAAVRLASEQALLRGNVNAIFKNLSRRSQGLVERQLLLIDNLENSERDPGQLAQLFKLDHLATRMRRNNENLLVLAGEETARRWTEAVQLVDVARAAAAEVEQYERIMFGEIPRTRIVGKSAPDVAHLVAELLENATTYSSPQTKVWVAARSAEDGGVMIHIEDVGIGMTAADIERSNTRLSNPPLVDVSVSRQMGLFVVGRLAARYGISVRLSESQAGGVTASIHLPVTLVDLGHMAGLRADGGTGAAGGPGLGIGALAGRGGLAGSSEPGWGGSGGSNGGFSGMRRRDEPPTPPWPEPGPSTHEQPAVNGAAHPGVLNGFARAMRQPINPVNDPTWFEPKRGQRDEEPGIPRQQPQRQPQQPQQRQQPSVPRQSPQQPLPLRQRPQAPRQAPAPSPPVSRSPDADTERLPIYEAVESEWFRRRGSRPPHSGWSPRAAQPWDPAWSGGVDGDAADRKPAGAQAPAGQAFDTAQAFDTQSFETADRFGTASQGYDTAEDFEPSAPAIVESDTGSAASWSSPGDDAWQAAAALANPARDGVTTTGLPKRVPKANLVPGSAGGTGAGRATPPPGLSSTAEAVRKRLSTFRRNSQQLAGEGGDRQ